MKEQKGSSCGWSNQPQKNLTQKEHQKTQQHHASDKKSGQKKGW